MPVINKNISMITTRAGGGVTFGEVTYGPGGTCPGHRGEPVQFVVILTGEATVLIDGLPHALPAGNTAFLPPGTRRDWTFTRNAPTHHLWCTFRPELLTEADLERIPGLPFRQPFSPAARDLFRLGLETPPPGSRPESAALLEALAVCLFREYVSQAGVENAGVRLHPAVERARACLDARFAEAWPLSRLAAEARLSPNHLVRLFRRQTGVTPATYLWSARLEQGVQLLRHTGLTVREIAFRCGFASPFHFSRLVKARHGAAPRELRKGADVAGTTRGGVP